VGGRSAMDEDMLDFLRTRSGTRIELVGDFIETMSVNDGVRGGKSYVLSSFSKSVLILGDTRSRVRAGWVGRMPYFSGRCAYWLGLRHDSNSASSRGVAARREKPRIRLWDLFQQYSRATATPLTTSVPTTAPRMAQTFVCCSMVGSVEMIRVDDDGVAVM